MYSPLTPLDFGFASPLPAAAVEYERDGFTGGAGFGFVERMERQNGCVREEMPVDDVNAERHAQADLETLREISFFDHSDSDEEEQSQSRFTSPSPSSQDDDELLGVDPFGVIPRPSIDSVAQLRSAGRSAVSLGARMGKRGECGSPLVAPPELPLPKLPEPLSKPSHQQRKRTPSPLLSSSPGSSSSSSPDWTLALPFLDSPSSFPIPSPDSKERKGWAKEPDWTLGLDLTWSSGMLMGDERGYSSKSKGKGRVVRGRSGSPFPMLDLGARRRVLSNCLEEDEERQIEYEGRSVQIHEISRTSSNSWSSDSSPPSSSDRNSPVVGAIHAGGMTSTASFYSARSWRQSVHC